MVSRYFGLAKFGTIYGWIFTAALAGNAVGSSILGWAFQLTHSYSATLVAYSLLLAVATGFILAWALTAIHPPIVTTCPPSLRCEQKTYELMSRTKLNIPEIPPSAGTTGITKSCRKNTSLRFRGSSGK